MYEYKAIVQRIYDADTMRLDIDLGCGIWLRNEAVRLYRINAPEVRGPERAAGIRARDALRDLLPKGTEVLINTIKDKRGKYGRYLVDVLIGDLWINKWLVDKGYAERRDY